MINKFLKMNSGLDLGYFRNNFTPSRAIITLKGMEQMRVNENEKTVMRVKGQ